MTAFIRFWFVILTSLTVSATIAQEITNSASVNSSIGDDGTGTIIVEARGNLPKPPVFFTAVANAAVEVGPNHIEQTIFANLKVVQGAATTLSLGINGDDRVIEVQGESLKSWSVRQEGDRRFLDLHVIENTQELRVQIKLQSRALHLRTADTLDLAHLAPGDAIGFTSLIALQYAPEVEAIVTNATGFAPLSQDDNTTVGKPNRFQSTTGGQLRLVVNRAGAAPAPVELSETKLNGDVHANGNSINFQYRSLATATVANAEITVLAGNAALSLVPTDVNYRIRLVQENGSPVYKLSFPKIGTFPIALDFVAALNQASADGRSMDFAVAAGAVVPLTINGLGSDIDFQRDQTSVVPQRIEQTWLGFLPASGRAALQWKSMRQAGEGKLFFASTGRIESQVAAGLLRQDHHLDFQVLQGSLPTIRIALD
ncbi:MAG: hypothetical protein Q8M16_07970, partial [Pirellulaceae bacterium]|nr:hypothetical protein [Pirellulaceae bacterium]